MQPEGDVHTDRQYVTKSRRRRLTIEASWALAAAVLTSAIGIWVLQLWRAHLRVPLEYGKDSTLNLVLIRDILVHGWYLNNHSLGAPFGQELYDFPAFSGDSLYLVIVKVLGIFSSDAALVENLFFLLAFPLIAIMSYLMLRRLGISVGVAIVLATLFSVLPARFDDGESHIFLGAYFMVPVSCYLILRLLDGHELFRRRPGQRGVRAHLTWRSAGIIALCIALGSSDNYYALFTVALMTMAVIATLLVGRRRSSWGGAVAILVILGAVALNGLPTIIYISEHGRDFAAARRSAGEGEGYSFALSNLVLPVAGDRVPALARLTQRYISTTPVPGSGEASFSTLGIVGTFGLLWLAVGLVARCMGVPAAGVFDGRSARAALGAGMAFLIGTVGGLATLFAFVVNPQLRAPDRIAIFIAFFAMYGAALALDRLRGHMDGRKFGAVTFSAILAVVLVIGALDQTSPSMIPKYEAVAAEYQSDAAFVRAIERQMPRGASIFQLPYVPFPEGLTKGVGPYDEANGFLHSTDLRWSYGAMVGRPANWEANLVGKPLSIALAAISAVGFQGVYVDSPGVSSRIIPTLRSELGVSPLVSKNRRLYFFSMAAYNQQLREKFSAATLRELASSTLHPPAG